MRFDHPYHDLPAENFWKSFVPQYPWRDLNIAGTANLKLQPVSKIATAGSCFAQHISRHLKMDGNSVYITETPHPLLPPESDEFKSYALFSARYGNIYTARQCIELFLQAFELIPMTEDFCIDKERIYDLLRPNAVPLGFTSLPEARSDRQYHLKCLRRMFETSDVFIFTLGLTEAWFNQKNYHTYPVCPGTAKGTFDPRQHTFYNFKHSEVLAAMEHLIERLAGVNPRLKIILTVSPVSLVATRTSSNVLLASSYSKSVLRAVCGELHEKYPQVQYFPSYEIINHAASFGQYLSESLRDVSTRGVQHVMGVFEQTFMRNPKKSEVNLSPQQNDVNLRSEGSNYLFQAECDELTNDFLNNISK